MPWNPIRLEQRMGRIHRIGQQRRATIFNFVADNTVEGKHPPPAAREARGDARRTLGRPRLRRHRRAAEARTASNFEGLLREARAQPEALDDDARAQIERTRPRALQASTRRPPASPWRPSTSTSSWVRRDGLALGGAPPDARVRRAVLPARVRALGLRLEPRADGLWRIEHVPRALLAEPSCAAVKRLGRPQPRLPQAHVPQGDPRPRRARGRDAAVAGASALRGRRRGARRAS